MTTLTADSVGDRHRYLAHARPDFARSMAGIVNQGGPWACPNGHASLLDYRCSVCGKDLTES